MLKVVEADTELFRVLVVGDVVYLGKSFFEESHVDEEPEIKKTS